MHHPKDIFPAPKELLTLHRKILPACCKNREGRTIPLEGELAEVIERRQKARQFRQKRNAPVIVSEYIFHRKGTPIVSFRKTWANACKFAGVPGRLFHDLRRCAARNLLAAGVPQAVAIKITGHKTDSMFRRYAIRDRGAATRGFAAGGHLPPAAGGAGEKAGGKGCRHQLTSKHGQCTDKIKRAAHWAARSY
jgi:integrase